MSRNVSIQEKLNPLNGLGDSFIDRDGEMGVVFIEDVPGRWVPVLAGVGCDTGFSELERLPLFCNQCFIALGSIVAGVDQPVCEAAKCWGIKIWMGFKDGCGGAWGEGWRVKVLREGKGCDGGCIRHHRLKKR